MTKSYKSYIEFRKIAEKPKTSVYAVISKSSDDRLDSMIDEEKKIECKPIGKDTECIKTSCPYWNRDKGCMFYE